ncbi:intermembrane lipid transfer protein VPS13B isoform X2 [Battus philenor]|uniref:intermembrane lipid transfer protein VPS13B isoform X2 n=1 Tax=Battus philenor TaxID=42288 RepID=UPI0035D0967B
MFKIESYITPILLSYVDKYVKDFKPADAQVSLWGGGVALHNLVLKADVLQQEVSLPFTLVSGRIHELLIQVPWTKIMSEPIIITIDTIECILSLQPPPEEYPPSESTRSPVVEAPPGYMRALVRRVVSNISVRVHHLIVKYVQDDIVLSLNVKHLAIDSADTNWEPAFADISASDPAIRRLVHLDDLTLCLDRADADGKIRFYQEPLLYRCQLDFRVLTRLVSAIRRRAKSISIWVRADRLAGGASGEQLALLVRLLRERPSPPPPPAPSHAAPPPAPSSSTASLEGSRSESWSEWAWSWLPAWEGAGSDDTLAPPAPAPLTFAAYFDSVSFTLKVMEAEVGGRRRARGVLELEATHAAVRSYMCAPTTLRLRAGARLLVLRAQGKCVCGHYPSTSPNDEPSLYLSNIENTDETWSWPEGDDTVKVEPAVAVDEQFRGSPEVTEPTESTEESPHLQETVQNEENDELWSKMSPVVFFEYCHDRAPPDTLVDPYDSPPIDFQYSDWAEDSSMVVRVRPLQVTLCGGLVHRLQVVTDVVSHLPPHHQPEQQMRTLTVEECEALSDNLPQRRCSVEVRGLRLRIWPWYHAPQRTPVPLLLDVELPLTEATIVGPLYSYRVCSAACQMPEDEGVVWSGARMHVTLNMSGVFAGVRLPTVPMRNVARMNLRLAAHSLLHPGLFEDHTTVRNSYTVNIREASVCGSWARLVAAREVLDSLLSARLSPVLAYSTLAHDSLHDEELVAVDLTLEELTVRGYLTRDLRTHIASLHAARAIALHAPKGADLKQAWLFSGPEAPTTSPYLRVALQWRVVADGAKHAVASSTAVEFTGIWFEPTAISLDPLLLAGLTYSPRYTATTDVQSQSTPGGPKTMTSSQYFMLRRTTPPSSSGRGGSRTGSGAEVHARPRSTASSSERSDQPQSHSHSQHPLRPRAHSHQRQNNIGKHFAWLWSGEMAVRAHARLRRALACCELGLVQVYVPGQSAAAAGHASLRDAVERHAARRAVLVLSLGHLSMHSNTMVKHLWNEIRHDGPTYFSLKTEQQTGPVESFPWRLRIADVSCYTLEPRASTTTRSMLRDARTVAPRAVLGLLTTTVTLSIVTKTLQVQAPPTAHRTNRPVHDEKVKYFTSGVDFKPSTLKEFIRGPAKNKKSNPETKTSPEPAAAAAPAPPAGPLVSLGVHIHADTPPVTLRFDNDQVGVLADALHCFSHLMALLRRPSFSAHAHAHSRPSLLMSAPSIPTTAVTPVSKSFIRSVSEIEEQETPSEDTLSENRSELIPIYEESAISLGHTKTFVWVQWVVSRAMLAVSAERARLAAEADDIIATIDLQPHYSQLKLKVASASLRHYRRSDSDEWEAGALGGRVLEAREPVDAKEDNHFLSLTITQAQISNLPASWKEELHPKLLEQKSQLDTMWEVYATVAPLEAVLQASVVQHAAVVLRLLRPRAESTCLVNVLAPVICSAHPYSLSDQPPVENSWQPPFFYLTAGGLRLLLINEENRESTEDDTLMLMIGKITVNPHPENPICRRVVSSCGEVGAWGTNGGAPEGRQYEALARGVALRSARFHQLVRQEVSEAEIMKGTGGENPALKWSQPIISPVITPILQPVELECVVAPAVVTGGTLMSGPALELNLASDCALELSLHQLSLAVTLLSHMRAALVHRRDTEEVEELEACPYTPSGSEIPPQDSSPPAASLPPRVIRNEPLRTEAGHSTADSGVGSAGSQSANKPSLSDEPAGPVKKNVSIALANHLVNPWEYLEVFVTMGVIEATLYAVDNGAEELAPLRAQEPATSDHVPTPPANTGNVPPAAPAAASEDKSRPNVNFEETKEANKKDDTHEAATAGSSSVTDNIKPADIDKSHPDLTSILPPTRKSEGTLLLIQLTMKQPNLYYWQKDTQKTLQLSLFDAGVALGGGASRRVLLSTERGALDPLTDIPPALATLKLVLPSIGASGAGMSSGRGTLNIDVERPVLFDVCTDRLLRMHTIIQLVKKQLNWNDAVKEEDPNESFVCRVRRLMGRQGLESISLNTGQVGVRGGAGAGGWGGACAHVIAASRPDRLSVRVLLRALLASAGAPHDCRHPLLLPTTVGGTMEASWEGWRRSESGSGRKAGLRCALHTDAITLDVRPADLHALDSLLHAHQCLRQLIKAAPRQIKSAGPSPTVTIKPVGSQEDITDHYYKDDLRSGAFKLVQGGQVPMAYQVRAANGALTWRYPHPRGITRLLVFPVPGLNQEVECVLELFESTLMRWETHTYFHLPTNEPREIVLDPSPPDMVFALMWRVRVCSEVEPEPPPFLFNAKNFMSQPNILGNEAGADMDTGFVPSGGAEGGTKAGSGCQGPCGHGEEDRCELSAEQLWGILRVDSYFAPRLLPAVRFAIRFAALTCYLHNDLPRLHTEKSSSLEGLYVSRPLRREHRVLALAARDVAAHATVGELGQRCLLNAHVSGDIMECTTGTMERFIDEFRVQAALSRAGSTASSWRVRSCADRICASLHVPRLHTLHALAQDWKHAHAQYILKNNMEDAAAEDCERAEEACLRLRGRVSLWLHNACAAPLRVSQHATDELLPLSPAAMLAYRWRSPYETKKLRFSIANPSADWRWSASIPFTEGTYRVRLEEVESCTESSSGSGAPVPGAGVFVYARVSDHGATRTMRLTGRLFLANMLRHALLYKVRARCSSSQQWRTIGSGELHPERVGLGLLCDATADLALKVKFVSHDTGWSGDIPIKECPKENVPWLVKVPSGGEVAYVSMWCRVTRARSDGRLLAAFWPLYVLRSHLSLDTEVVINTETVDASATNLEDGTASDTRPPGLVQSAPGRGASTHLAAPGTTAARHSLTLQYRNIECPVTREAVPLHYGVTDTSVFDKCAPVHHIEDVLQEINVWLEQSNREARSEWPYSLVRRHWQGTWQPSLLQPRCDVTVRYTPVVAGGGCSLMARLCPAALLANASPIPLTLRAHDAAPLCRLEPGHAVSPPSTLLTKPFFLSLDVGRETFVSEPLCVSTCEPGRYGTPPPAHLTLGHATHIAIHCNQKVALLTMYYEIKEDINVLGITSTYVLFNNLDTEISVTCIAVPEGLDDDVILNPKSFKVIPPAKKERDKESVSGEPLCRAWAWGRWRGGTRARAFLCVSMARGAAVPIRLATPPALPSRRAIALRDRNDQTVAVVVTQQQHDDRWQVVVAPDPCPQFLVNNRSRCTLAIGQPLEPDPDDKESYKTVKAARECTGARWWCTVRPGDSTHYSSPAYCARYPAPATAAPPASLSSTSQNVSDLTFLTFAHASEDDRRPQWCPAVAVADGEHLLQLVGGDTLKLRVRTAPHSTLLELQDIEQHDISASDIRKRLVGSSSAVLLHDHRDIKESTVNELERINAADNLMELSMYRERLELLPSESNYIVKDEIKSRISEASAAISITNTTEKNKLTTEGDKENNEQVASKRADERRVHDSTEVSSTASMGRMQTTSVLTFRSKDFDSSGASMIQSSLTDTGLSDDGRMSGGTGERVRCEVRGVQVRLAAASDHVPLLALHFDELFALYRVNTRRGRGTVMISSLQVDNTQYASGQYDFAVVAISRTPCPALGRWPPLWGAVTSPPPSPQDQQALYLEITTDAWTVANQRFNELTEIEIRAGPLALYVEDGYVRAVATLLREAWPASEHTDAHAHALSSARTLQRPLRLRALVVHQLDLALTLHTAVRMYIALDQSPLRLGAFQLRDVMTSIERLTHALTVHYLSAALLSAGWVVGGLELVGAPGALAARVGGAGGGVRGMASAAAAALLRSLSAAAGSLARNLDLLAGDHEHAQRAAAARRHPPPSFLAGLAAGLTNFAINILGAVGGLAHHPVVGVCVGEAGGGAALRRGLLGALTKPLSATADLVAYAGHGLLAQTGWDATPQARKLRGPESEEGGAEEVWRRECVRWAFRLAELPALAGFRVLLDNAPLLLIITHKFLVVADPETERIVEMIDLKSCTVQPLEGHIIELLVKQRRPNKIPDGRAASDEDNEYQISAAAMARVARYTGTSGGAAMAGVGASGGVGASDGATDTRVLLLRNAPAHAHALHAALAAAAHHNCPAHFPLL